VKTILAVAALLLFSPSSRAIYPQTGPDHGSIFGRVIDARNGEGLYSIQAFIVEGEIGTLSNRDGLFLLQGVPLGEATIRFQHHCFHSVTVKVQLTSEIRERRIDVGMPYDVEQGSEKGCDRRIR